MSPAKKKTRASRTRSRQHAQATKRLSPEIESAPRDATTLAGLPARRRVELALALGARRAPDWPNDRDGQGACLARALGVHAAGLESESSDGKPATLDSASVDVVELEISTICRDRELQPRQENDLAVIDDYGLAADELPPVTVFNDDGTLLLADGHLRVAAMEKAGRKTIQARIRSGGRRDALYFALDANKTHGQRLTNEDKRRAVMLMLEDREWAQRSNEWIAEHIGVSAPLVAKVRGEGGVAPTRRISKDGRPRETAHIGRTVASKADPGGARPTERVGLDGERDSKYLELAGGVADTQQSASAPVPGVVPNRHSDDGADSGLSTHVANLRAQLTIITEEIMNLAASYRQVLQDARALGPSLATAHSPEIESQFAAIEWNLRAVTPHAPCPSCTGSTESCFPCLGGRWIAAISILDAIAKARDQSRAFAASAQEESSGP